MGYTDSLVDVLQFNFDFRCIRLRLTIVTQGSVRWMRYRVLLGKDSEDVGLSGNSLKTVHNFCSR